MGTCIAVTNTCIRKHGCMYTCVYTNMAHALTNAYMHTHALTNTHIKTREPSVLFLTIWPGHGPQGHSSVRTVRVCMEIFCGAMLTPL